MSIDIIEKLEMGLQKRGAYLMSLEQVLLNVTCNPDTADELLREVIIEAEGNILNSATFEYIGDIAQNGFDSLSALENEIAKKVALEAILVERKTRATIKILKGFLKE